jgi:hypothetical protein
MLDMKRFYFFGLMFSLMLNAAFSYADQDMDYIQAFESGSINWTKGVLRGKGIGSLSEKIGNQDKSRSTAINSAIQQARRNLLVAVYKIRIDSVVLVEEIIDSNKDFHEKILRMVEKAELVNQEYLSDGTVGVTLEMSIYAGFSELTLPLEIIQLETIKPIGHNAVYSDQKRNGIEVDGRKVVSANYTGLVVNAIGLNVLPAMAPMVIDEKGEQVYGAAYVSRDFAVRSGMSSYIEDLQAALKSKRVGKNPLVVRGLRTNGPALSVIVISNADAAKIRSSSENLKFLKKCRVMIVLD